MSYTDIADRTTVDHPRAGSGNPRGWTFAGIAAGIAGITGIAASMSIDAVYDTDLGGDPQRIVDRLSELTANMLVFHVATMVAVVTLVVFAAGLRRRLAAQAPSGSALPDVAAGGLLLTSVAGLMGAGLNTEFIFGLQDPAASGVLPRRPCSTTTGSAPSRGCGWAQASPVSPWPSPPCVTRPPRAGSASSAPSSAD